MSFFSRLFKKVEKVNKNEISLEDFEESLEMDEDSAQEEAMDQWVEMAQNVIVNSVKAAKNNVERAFILIDFNEMSPSFDVFYQVDGQLRYWHELSDEEVRRTIEQELLPQAGEVTSHIHQLFEEANLEKIGYAQLQFEAETMAWFSHIIWSNSEEASLEKDEMLDHWFLVLKDVTQHVPLNSDQKLPWYP